MHRAKLDLALPNISKTVVADEALDLIYGTEAHAVLWGVDAVQPL